MKIKHSKRVVLAELVSCKCALKGINRVGYLPTQSNMASPTESSMAAEDYDDGEELYDAHSTNEGKNNKLHGQATIPTYCLNW